MEQIQAKENSNTGANTISDTDSEYITFIGSAPGKIIITGEHAVVYGHGAIAVAIELKTTCITKLSKREKLSDNISYDMISIKEVSLFNKNKLLMLNNFLEILNTMKENLKDSICEYDIEKLVELVKNKKELQTNEKLNDVHFYIIFNLVCSYVIIKNNTNNNSLVEYFIKFINEHQIDISISSEIPHNAGLGSSAAYNVSLVSSLLKLAEYIVNTYNNNQNKEITKEVEALTCLSYAGEKIFHSKPSGIDNITSIYGGVILFKSLKEFKVLESAELFLESHFDLYLVDSKVRRETKTFIAKVTDFKKNYEQIFLNCANSISYIVDKFYNYMQSESNSTQSDLEKFYKMVEVNQNLLQIIQVSCNEIDEVVHFLKVNKISSKLTGAGGGGFVLAFLPKDSDAPKRLEKDYPFIKCNISLSGAE